MAAVRDVSERPCDSRLPQVCLDETSTQRGGEGRPPTPLAPGQPAQAADAYVRKGVANLFVVTEPLRGWRHVTVTDPRTAVDCAPVIRVLVAVHYPDAERIVLVLDNLNPPTPAARYAAFPPAAAHRLAARLEWPYTPPHGRWLNSAAVEFSVLARQCLDRRIAEQSLLKGAIAMGQARRTQAGTGVRWRFRTAAARVKLHRVSPSIPE